MNMLEAVLAEAEKKGSPNATLVAAVPFRLPPSASKALIKGSDNQSPGSGNAGGNPLRIITGQQPPAAGDGVKPSVNQLGEFGCAARISRVERIELQHNGKKDKGYVVVLQGVCRVRVDRFTMTGTPYFEAQVTALPRKTLSEDPIKEESVQRFVDIAQRIITTLEAALPKRNGPRAKQPLPTVAQMSESALEFLRASVKRLTMDTADELSDVLISSLLPATRPASYPAKVHHLSIFHANGRVSHAAAQLELLNAGLQAREAVDDRFNRNAQRRAREQVLKGLLEAIIMELRALKKEEAEDHGLPDSPRSPRVVRIGGRSGAGPGQAGGHQHDDSDEEEEEDEMASLSKAIEESSMPDEARNTAKKEFKRLQSIPSMSPEHGKIREYLDWMVSLPWGKSTFDIPGAQAIDKTFLDRARAQLESDHFGIHKVKERLLQYMAVLRLKHEGWQAQEAKREAEEEAQRQAEETEAKRLEEEKKTTHGASKSDVKAEQQDGDNSSLAVADDEDDLQEPAESSKPAVKKKVNTFRDKGPILCLVGPPGVGKTSIARSLATAMGRPFSRCALGGIRDEAEIRGFRRTYVGSMPGIFIQQMRKVGVNNPVILLDEIDKLSSGSGAHGDPSAAMLEVLDPEQNHTFTDHYINTPVDLSSVLFIATANSLDTIPAPLLDRMETIHLSGYVDLEKLQIARKYLLPKQLQANSLKPAHIKIDDDALLAVINRFCGRESGVRNLERQVGSVCRWKAVELSRARDHLKTEDRRPIDADVVPGYNPDVKTSDLDTILGHDFPEPERVEDEAHVRPGCAVGLGYTGSGTGCILVVEVTSMPGKGGLRLTGSLGNVISESAQIALSWVKANAFDLGLAQQGEDLVEKVDLHLHMPEGAMKKDGPSAGVAMCMSMLSLFSGQALDPRLAMTGEITLRGKVTAVGGIREKCLAAASAGVKRLILPERNRKDAMADLPEKLRNELEIVFVDNIWQAIEYAFPTRSWNLPGPTQTAKRPVARLLNKL